ncbi:alpha/beta hydrolase [Rhizobium lusitanum]|uniref:alpha/beta hydrolase n=1 Tax=Rhizobium lusitanum TaxID=293958 RepID=UPI00195F19A1|nr:alpha/beta fold hydrolase [Rhizobium lusitanum]MBM7046311.1 alpha/beta fold hydrolase [Rhizobium lusitanum]
MTDLEDSLRPKVQLDDYVMDGIRIERYRQVSQPNKRGDIICVHGGGQASWAWQDTAPIYAAGGFDVHALNWLGRNGSDAIEPGELLTMSIADVVHDISKVAQQFESPPILVAHSMGALASQIYAQGHDVRALLLLTPVVPREAGAETVEMPISMDRLWGPPPLEVASQFFFQGLDEEHCKKYYALLVAESPLRAYEATRFTLSVDPARITMPVAIVSGALDTLTPASAGEALAKLYKADYRVEPHQGHNALLGDNAKRLAESLVPWLQSHC